MEDRPADSNRDENGDYIVGKGRPPVHTRFQEGHVGNKRGPKPGDVDLLKTLSKALNKKEPIKIGGKRVSKSTVDIAAHNLRALVAEKNLGAIKFVVELQVMIEARLEKSRGTATAISAEQRAFISNLLTGAGYDPSPVVRRQPGDHGEQG